MLGRIDDLKHEHLRSGQKERFGVGQAGSEKEPANGVSIAWLLFMMIAFPHKVFEFIPRQ